MPDVAADDVAARAAQRALVRRGYDAISLAYRGDDGRAASSSAEDVSRYAGWVAELAGLLPAGGTVADLGCGAGIPATRELAGYGLRVIGVDFSAVQLARARRLVPAASLVRADLTEQAPQESEPVRAGAERVALVVGEDSSQPAAVALGSL
jgi:SAM-dependent methyltransferase